MKSTIEKINVMHAYLDGKKIQYKDIIGNWTDTENPAWDWSFSDYRIKPEPKEPTYRPYESVAEMLCDYKRRVCKINNQPKNTMPLIWVRGLPTAGSVVDSMVCGFDNNAQEVWVGGVWRLTMKGLFNKFTYLDGTPCGKLVEE